MWLSDPSYSFVNDIIGGAIALVASSVVAVVVGGLNIFGSGLTSSSVRILFGVSVLLSLLFQINVVHIPVGLGLINTLFEAFGSGSGGVFSMLGFVICLLFSLVTLVSGLIMIVQSGGGD